MKGGRLRVINETSYPDDEVRALVQYGMQEIDLRGTGITVLVKNTKRRKTRGLVEGKPVAFSGEYQCYRRGINLAFVKYMAEKDKHLAIIRVGPPECFPSAEAFCWYDESFLTWQEAVVGVTAHEGMHAQHEHDNAYVERSGRRRVKIESRTLPGGERTVERYRIIETRVGTERIEPKAEAFERHMLLRYRREHSVHDIGAALTDPVRQEGGERPMATVIVQTDDGREVWRMGGVEPWHVVTHLIAHGNVRASSLASGIVRAVQDADKIQRGADPERPSERAMREVFGTTITEQIAKAR